jgi:hypothetical protein
MLMSSLRISRPLNVNAFFELGIRYALKPRATICIAESGFKNPFDTNHIKFTPYDHAGNAIDFGEVERMRAVLTAACKAARDGDAIDSPVYTFLRQLKAPDNALSRHLPAFAPHSRSSCQCCGGG